MGYTHYFGFKGEKLSQQAMNKIAKDVAIIEHHLKGEVTLGDYGGENEGVEYTMKIQNEKSNVTAFGFNGMGEYAHETLSFRVGEMPYDFCKTEYKPYDLAVCTTLLCAKFHLNSMTVKSDGDGEDWGDSLNLFKELFPTRTVSFELTPTDSGISILNIKR